MRSVDLLGSVTSVPRHEAERLLVIATGLSRSNLLVGVDISDAQWATFVDLLARREADEPLQYIEGFVPFGPAELIVDQRVLVPRPETEYLFELITRTVTGPSIVVDLCTGSGNLAVALGKTFPHADIYATDLSPDAAEVARANVERNNARVTVLEGDLFDPVPDDLRGSVDLVVANPPYLADVEFDRVPADVKMEPRMALVAGPRGDEVVTSIARQLEDWLAPNGQFAVEVSEFHAAKVIGDFAHLDAVMVPDLAGRDRFVMSRTLVE